MTWHDNDVLWVVYSSTVSQSSTVHDIYYCMHPTISVLTNKKGKKGTSELYGSKILESNRNHDYIIVSYLANKLSII